MISICLPIYNFDVNELVDELLRQAREFNINIEILAFDDASLSYYKKRNTRISVNSNVHYLEFDYNLGRSRIRNRLADFAQGSWLLFLDCDMIPELPNFLNNYNSVIDQANVICGGTSYGPKPCKKELLLRWRYGVYKENKHAIRRQTRPYASFLSGNFMIRKDIFHQIRFNEAISGYGHEDTLFGLDLKRNKVPTLHIQNPCIHLGIEPCFDYLLKTEQGIINLVKLLSIVPQEKKNLRRNIKLLRVYHTFRILGLGYPLRWFFKVFNPLIRRVLCSNRPSTVLFDLYKLGMLAQLFKTDKLQRKNVG